MTPKQIAGIDRATAADAPAVAVLAGELLGEIMTSIGIPAFNFELEATTGRLRDYLAQEKYFVFVARDADGTLAGFIALIESYALYAEGAFGTIPEFYVRPQWRNNSVGRYLVGRAVAFGTTRGWTRLEVTTPPLPEFARTLAFYEREGFSISGGRKLKRSL